MACQDQDGCDFLSGPDTTAPQSLTHALTFIRSVQELRILGRSRKKNTAL